MHFISLKILYKCCLCLLMCTVSAVQVQCDTEIMIQTAKLRHFCMRLYRLEMYVRICFLLVIHSQSTSKRTQWLCTFRFQKLLSAVIRDA